MGADKNSSPKRELVLCPKFTTKDSHTSLPRSRSHNGPTNLRDKPQTIPKRKHNSRSKGLSNPAQDQTDCPRPSSGQSVKRNRTTRSALEMWTVRTLLTDCPRATCVVRTVRDLRADGLPNLLPQNFGTSKDPCANSQELNKHAMNTERADRTEQLELQNAKSTSPTHPWISQTA
jgi:hypothetical protein